MGHLQTRFFVNAAKMNNFLYESSHSNCSPANNQQAPTTSRFKGIGNSKTKDSRFLALDITYLLTYLLHGAESFLRS